MKRLSLLACLCFALPAIAQEPIPAKVTLTDLDFMKGTWKGEGYMITGKDQKFPFSVSTTVGTKLRGKVFFIEQEGTQTDGANKGKAIADFLGTISLNPDQSGFITNFVGTDGVSLSGDGRIENKALVYEQVNGPGLFTRTTISVKEGVWTQKTELSDDGKRFFIFMEAKLKKNGE